MFCMGIIKSCCPFPLAAFQSTLHVYAKYPLLISPKNASCHGSAKVLKSACRPIIMCLSVQASMCADWNPRSSGPDSIPGRVVIACIRSTASTATSVISYCIPRDRSWRLLLALACDNLDLLCFDVVRVVKLEFDILDNERPDLVTEAVGVEVSLKKPISTCHNQIMFLGEVSIP